MSNERDLIGFLSATGKPVPGHKPWPRFRLDKSSWFDLAARLEITDWALLGIWGELSEVHAAFFDDAKKAIAVASLPCPDGKFPSLSRARPGAIRMERTMRDMLGLTPEHLADNRPWLDHGQFAQKSPLLDSSAPATPRPAVEYDFLPIEGEGLHQIPVGPVHAGVIEPGHFRFTANGETVVRLEERLGYVHKGFERHMQGRTPLEAAKIAARISGDSTVAHSLAFARAVEAALDVQVSPRAHAIRAIMAELERIANHFGDVGAICNDAAFAFMHAGCNILREKVMGAAKSCFGHRLMMDKVIPGGVVCDLDREGTALLAALTGELRQAFAPLVELYENKGTLLDRTVSTGIVSASLVHRFGAGGHVGRASARSFDVRRAAPYAPYDSLDFEVPVFNDGDVNARVWVRISEIGVSLSIIDQLLSRLPKGQLAAEIPAREGEGMALVEAFRGEILTWVRLGPNGRVLRCHPRDASWLQWPLLEAAIEGNIVADFPLCNKSFNCSYSGADM